MISLLVKNGQHCLRKQSKEPSQVLGQEPGTPAGEGGDPRPLKTTDFSKPQVQVHRQIEVFECCWCRGA